MIKMESVTNKTNPTYDYEHRSDFCNMCWFWKGSLVYRELSRLPSVTEGLTTPPPLRGTSPYTGEALVRHKAGSFIITFLL